MGGDEREGGGKGGGMGSSLQGRWAFDLGLKSSDREAIDSVRRGLGNHIMTNHNLTYVTKIYKK